MTLTHQSCGALVLAGGRGSRLGGVEKALLLLNGETLLHHLEQELSPFPEKLLSTNDPALARGTSFLPVADRRKGCGPLEGIAAALSVAKSPALLVLPCDMPGYTAPWGNGCCPRDSRIGPPGCAAQPTACTPSAASTPKPPCRSWTGA